jgi:sigma-B regulation protein RsbU (phosphoserine phosphatase)
MKIEQGDGYARHFFRSTSVVSKVSVAVLLGFPAPAPITDEQFMGHIEPLDREAEASAFASARAADRPTYDCVCRLNGADEMQRTVRASGETSFTDGLLVHFVGVLQDIAELAAQRATAEDRARFSEQMIGIVSRDLRNPLTAIRMGMQMLGNPAAAPARRERLTEHMDASIDRALRLVEDLLDFTQARMGSGMTVKRREVDIHQEVAGAIGELRLAFPQRAMVHVHEGSGPCLADANRLTQLLGNLVGNAMAYGDPEQPVTVTIRVGLDTFDIEVHNFGAPSLHRSCPCSSSP